MVDNKSTSRLLALYFSLLIILLPIEMSFLVSAQWVPPSQRGSGGTIGSSYSGSGAYLYIKSVTAQDGYEGFRRRIDTVTIVVQASLGPNKTITGDDLEVRLNNFALGKFSSCSQVSSQDGTYECAFTESETAGPLTATTQSYIVNLLDNNTVASSTSEAVIVDNAAPQIKSFVPSTTKTSTNELSVYIDVKDYAYGTTSGVGLRSVTVTVDGEEQYRFPEGDSSDNDEYDSLNVNTRVEKTIPITLNDVSGTYEICVYGEDYFDHYVNECKSVELDKNAPSIIDNSFRVVTIQNEELSWFSDQTQALNAYVEFQAQDLDQSSIYVDVSDANINGGYTHLSPSSCQPKGNYTYECRFVFDARINLTKSYKFYFNASDSLGNSAYKEFYAPFKFDNTGPSATGMRLSHNYNGIYFLGHKGETLYIDFQESGIGINNSEVYIDLSDIGMGSSVRAANCTPSWECVWPNIQASPSALSSLPYLSIEYNIDGTDASFDLDARLASIDVLFSSEDDIGNKANASSFEIAVDVFDPVIETTNITPINSSIDFEDFTVVGDSIYILFNVSDANSVDMQVLADDFIEGYNETFDCQTYPDGMHTCYHILGPITNEGPYEGVLTFKFIDPFSNTATYNSDPIKIFGIQNETTDYWDAKVLDCSPDPLDRELVQKIRSNLFCDIVLEENNNVEIYDIREGNCVDLPADVSTGISPNISTLSDYNWMAITRNEPNVYLNIETSTFDSRINQLNYGCELHIRSILNNNVVTQHYEPVNMNISIGLYNSPLGEISDQIWTEIEDLYETYVDGAWGILGYLHGFFELSEKLCKIGDTLRKIILAWRKLNLLMGVLTTSVKLTGEGWVVVKPATDAVAAGETQVMTSSHVAESGAETGLFGSWEAIFSKYCAFVTCKLTYGGEGWTKWMKTLDTIVNVMTGDFLVRWADNGFEGNPWQPQYGVRTGDGTYITKRDTTQPAAEPTSQPTSQPTSGTNNQPSTVTDNQPQPARGSTGAETTITRDSSANAESNPVAPTTAEAVRVLTGYSVITSYDTTEPPAAEPPAAEPPATEPPATEPPATEPPAADPPAADPPAAEPPAAEPPAAEPPATEPPAAEPPAAETPSQPTTQPPSLQDMTTYIEQRRASRAATTTTTGGSGTTASSATPYTYAQIDRYAITAASDEELRDMGLTPVKADGTYDEDFDYDTYFATLAQTEEGQNNLKNLNNDYTKYQKQQKQQDAADKKAADQAKQDGGKPITLNMQNTADMGLRFGGLDPKENWVMALATLCVPGMIANLEKYRQIQCMYGDCLVTHSTESIPIMLCDENKAYAECKFFYGALFEFMPFANFISRVQQLIIEILTNPLVIVDILLSWMCKPKVLAKLAGCGTPSSPSAVCSAGNFGVFACETYSTFTLFSDIYNDYKTMTEKGYWDIGIDPEREFCGRFAEGYETLKETVEGES